MANAFDLSQKALGLFLDYHGAGTSTYLQCQALAGYWWQVAYEGSGKNVIAYASARTAGNASSMFTRSLTDKRIQPGDSVFWDWNPYDHVAVAVGWDGDRLLVAHTGGGGSDTVYNFGNSFRISHADTLSLPVWGVSRTNGQNTPRTGVSAWPSGQNPSTPDSGQEDEEEMNTGIYYVEGGRQVNAIVNTNSGYFGEVQSSGAYNNGLAAAFRTGDWVKVTKSHFEAIRRQCEDVRKGK